jgi:hypothetical protein
MVRAEKLKRYSSCFGCKALANEGHRVCELGFKIKPAKHNNNLMVPDEKCHKPESYAHLITIQLSEDGKERANNAGVY